MLLDFRNCKTPEDVAKVFNMKKPEIEQSKDNLKKLADLINAKKGSNGTKKRIQQNTNK